MKLFNVFYERVIHNLYFESGISHFIFNSRYLRVCVSIVPGKIDANFREDLFVFVISDICIFLSINNFAQKTFFVTVK